CAATRGWPGVSPRCASPGPPASGWRARCWRSRMRTGGRSRCWGVQSVDVLRTACELAEALLASEAFAAYREAEIEFLNDDTAQDLLGRLEWERARWQAAAVSDPRSAREAWERVRALEADARANAAYA